jgi:hypothetical protein
MESEYRNHDILGGSKLGVTSVPISKVAGTPIGQALTGASISRFVIAAQLYPGVFHTAQNPFYFALPYA